jgi:hypothetical protein
MKRSSQTALILYIYLFARNFVSKEIFMHIVHFITAESYKEKEVLIEAESLCNLSIHYLLGLLVYLKQNVMINDKEKNIKGGVLVKDIERLLLHINIDHIVMHIDNIIEEKAHSAEESNRIVCEEGVSVLRMFDLFEYYTKPEQLFNIKSMLEVLGTIKKAHIVEKHEEPKLKVYVDGLQKKKIKHKIINYELNIPGNERQTQTSQQGIRKSITSSSVSASTVNAYKKLHSSKSDFGLLNESATVFCKDTIPSPSFIISSQKELNAVSKKQKEKWSMLNNAHYLSYKSS